jgi:hypothetical protein
MLLLKQFQHGRVQALGDVFGELVAGLNPPREKVAASLGQEVTFCVAHECTAPPYAS